MTHTPAHTWGRRAILAVLVIAFWPLILAWWVLKFVVLVVLPMVGLVALLGLVDPEG